MAKKHWKQKDVVCLGGTAQLCSGCGQKHKSHRWHRTQREEVPVYTCHKVYQRQWVKKTGIVDEKGCSKQTAPRLPKDIPVQDTMAIFELRPHLDAVDSHGHRYCCVAARPNCAVLKLCAQRLSSQYDLAQQVELVGQMSPLYWSWPVWSCTSMCLQRPSIDVIRLQMATRLLFIAF